MEKNGLYLSNHKVQSIQPRFNVSSRLCKRGSSRTPALYCTRLHVCTLAILGMLLGHFHSVKSMSTLCPSHCACSNVTSRSHTNAFVAIDCSRGNLLSFLDYASSDGQTRIYNNTYNNIPLLFQGDNKTELLVESEVESRENVWGRRTIDGDTSQEEVNNASNVSLSHDITLNLSFNNVSSLQALNNISNWKGAWYVKNLNLSSNGIETLYNSSVLGLFVNLVRLDLSHNLIDKFSSSILRNLISLKYLYLNHNKIIAVDLSPPFLPGLTILDLSRNQLTNISRGTFSAFPSLISLNLTHNSIVRFDQFALQGLSGLKYLSLSSNIIHSIDYPVFQNTSLVRLLLADMPHLSYLHNNVFKGLSYLQYLNLSANPRLDFLNPSILSNLISLNVIDLSGAGIEKLSPLTFHYNTQLHHIYLQNVSLSCSCTNAWLLEEFHKNDSIFHEASSLQCNEVHNMRRISVADAQFPCNHVVIHNMTSKVSVAIGSTLMLQCKQASASGGGILTWTTPRGKVFYFHHFHPNASQHLLSPQDIQPNAPFHKGHNWHNSSSYYSDLSSFEDRIHILTDGSLFLDYVLRSDAGPYTCQLKNAHYNSSGTIEVRFLYTISTDIKIIACVVGILCAFAFFTLNLVYVIITWLARHLINKRRREHISQMLENLNSYKSTQITRIYENYTGQLNRVRNRYHVQRDRLHRNYTMQVDRVKRGCSHQVEKVRENYNSKLTHLREYSSNQIVQIRDIANTQIGRIRDYGSLQLDRLRGTYKLQQQHMLKLLDTLNLDNCRSIVETECMRTESMMYDLDLLSQDDERTESPFSMVDSEYNTATSNSMISTGSTEITAPVNYETGEMNYNDRSDGEMSNLKNVKDSHGLGENEPCLRGNHDLKMTRGEHCENTISGHSLPSIDLKGVPLSTSYPDSYPTWEGDFVKQEESPTKIWMGTPDFFQYDDDENIPTVNLYDADIDEDDYDDEEKDKIKESDTMV